MGYNYYSDYYSASTAIDPATATTLMGAAMGVIMVYLVIILAIYVVQIIAMWKLFNKAGEKGWKSIIPIYNS